MRLSKLLDFLVTLKNEWNNIPCYTIGEATKDEAIKLGLFVIDSAKNASLLAEKIIGSKDSFIKPILFPCSSIKRDELVIKLERENIALECITSYCTVSDTEWPVYLTENVACIDQCSMIILVFFSPSGVNSFILQKENDIVVKSIDFKSVRIVSIGNTTANALKEAGLKVDGICENPNSRSCLDEIQRILSI